MALVYHPDKQDAEGSSDKPASGLSDKELVFIRIQEAYEVLSDQGKRRQYDSQMDFDESVPDEVDESIGFFKTFGPVFQRNARWSNRHPVPDLGDESTDIQKVHKFYDFWLSFDSWRDFSMHGEYNLDEAEFREERRWMERQNQKIVKGYDLEERRRILRLAETAERFDPRIRAEREEKEARKREEKERRARARQEEEDAKRQAVEDRRRKEEEEKARREEEERLARERRKEVQQVAKGLRQRLKKWASANCKLSTEESEELQQLCLASEPEALEALCSRLEAVAKKDADAAVRREMREFGQRRAEEAEQEKRAKEEARRQEEKKQNAAREAAAAAAAGSPWSTEELGILAKGLQKYPGGQAGRWNLIAQMLSATGHIRTDQEVIAKTKELSEGQSLRSMGATISATSARASSSSSLLISPLLSSSFLLDSSFSSFSLTPPRIPQLPGRRVEADDELAGREGKGMTRRRRRNRIMAGNMRGNP
ncbi:unnamed protein product [Prorocentrum cordatum]|uniref:J domain-containing protein n=1 Tax=Prorocentrum cordatum TaxID=2364126 RepID=A0ABN9W455_9DINO|nr:unnamed protein product [Polarella glacialis]